MMLNPGGDLLMVRKKGSKYFQLPGGKISDGELYTDTLIREIQEELGFDIRGQSIQFLGNHVTRAINEDKTLVEGHIYAIELDVPYMFSAHAELEEVVWITKENWKTYQLAHLAAEFVIPRWLSSKMY